MRGIAYVLLALFICVAVCRSFVQISDRPFVNYWRDLDGQKQELTDAHPKDDSEAYKLRSRMEQTLQAQGDYSTAENMLIDDFTRYQNSDADRDKFIHKARILAGLKIDLCAFDQAIDSYKHILKYDRQANKDDDLARDLNNIGLAYYMWACVTRDSPTKKKYQMLARDYYQQAEKTFVAKGLKDDLYANLMNQYLLMKDAGDNQHANDVFARVAQMNPAENKMNGELRRMMLIQD